MYLEYGLVQLFAILKVIKMLRIIEVLKIQNQLRNPYSEDLKGSYLMTSLAAY